MKKNVSVNFIITCVHCQRVNKVSCSFYKYFVTVARKMRRRQKGIQMEYNFLSVRNHRSKTVSAQYVCRFWSLTFKRWWVNERENNGAFRPLYDNKCKKATKIVIKLLNKLNEAAARSTKRKTMTLTTPMTTKIIGRVKYFVRFMKKKMLLFNITWFDKIYRHIRFEHYRKKYAF